MDTNASDADSTLLGAARSVSPTVQAAAAQIEEARQLPTSIVDALAQAGLFRMTVPQALGGEEADPETIIRVIEEVSKADGSAGWTVMIAATTGIGSGILTEDAAREVFAHDPAANAAIVIRPSGRALVVDGGYRLEGRWAFASGCTHATWLGACATIYDGDAPRRDGNGEDETRFLFVPAAACQIIDTWRVTGMRGTGSNDFAVADVFVPETRTMPSSADAWVPSQPGPLYRFGISLMPSAMAAVMLGIARNAITIVEGLAAVKKRDKGLLRDQEATQTQVGLAEAHLGAARAYLFESVRDVWQTACVGRPITTRQRRLVWLASVHAATLSTQAVDLMWDAAGSSAIFTSTPLERCFRDAHTGRKNVAIYPENYAEIGKMFLGVDRDVPPT